MLYLLAIVFPPLAILLCGRIGLYFLSIILCFFGWLPAVILALFIVNNHYAEQRNKKLIASIKSMGH